MSTLARRLAFSLVPVALLLGAGEGGLRAVGWPKAEAAFEHNEPYWVTDPNLHDQPFSHREENTTFAVSTDAGGLRAPLHEQDKRPGTFRVMTLGCSTTFGWGVDDASSYPARLEQLIRADGRTDVEVINGGQPGYTTFQGLWLWDSVLRHYQPDVVLIGYVVQDARRAAWSDRSQAILQADARYIKDHFFYRSRLYLALRAGLGQVQIRAKERVDGSEEGEYRVPPADYAANLRTFVEKVKTAGGTPVMFGFPLEREGYTGQHRRILAAAAEKLGVPHFDPQARMDEASRSTELYFEHDRGHANAEGNALIARWVYDFLLQENLTGKGP